MSEKYKELKEKYEEITQQISKLYEEQNEVSQLIKEECPHEEVIKVQTGPLIFEEEPTKYKCLGCYSYFTKEKVESMHASVITK